MEFECVCQKIMILIHGVSDMNDIGKDYSDYDKDYMLRTDAVWEKQQLKDWFRLTNKVYLFDEFRCSSSTLKIKNINLLNPKISTT